MPAHTIDEVIEHLDDLIAHARRAKNRLGYFAALYRNVTIKVKEGILAGSFEDAARMERLAPLGQEEMQKEIDVLDRWVDVLAFVIEYPPGISIRLATLFVRFTESRDVAKIIDVLT